MWPVRRQALLGPAHGVGGLTQAGGAAAPQPSGEHALQSKHDVPDCRPFESEEGFAVRDSLDSNNSFTRSLQVT